MQNFSKKRITSFAPAKGTSNKFYLHHDGGPLSCSLAGARILIYLKDTFINNLFIFFRFRLLLTATPLYEKWGFLRTVLLKRWSCTTMTLTRHWHIFLTVQPKNSWKWECCSCDLLQIVLLFLSFYFILIVKSVSRTVIPCQTS